MRHFLLTTGVLFSVALVGCSQSPQEQYDAAVESVNEAQSAIKDAKKKVDKTNEKIAAARKDHQKAQQALNEKQETLREARSKAQKQASDEILFRVLQRDVLTKDAFEKSAISVSVDQRVVTLTGSVPDADTRDEAVKLVRNQPGVANVRDQLELENDQQAAQKKSQKRSNNSSDQQNNG